MKNISLIILAILGITFSSFAQSEEINHSVIPEMEIFDLNDNPVSSDVLNNNGKPFVLVFWAVWNKTCLLELNTIHDSYDELKKKYGVKLFALSIDEEQRIERAKGYSEAKEWHYDVYFDHHGDLEHKMNILGVPHIILFDGNRQKVWERHEYHSGDEVELIGEIEKLMAK